MGEWIMKVNQDQQLKIIISRSSFQDHHFKIIISRSPLRIVMINIYQDQLLQDQHRPRSTSQDQLLKINFDFPRSTSHDPLLKIDFDQDQLSRVQIDT
jgi:hypothetical protein